MRYMPSKATNFTATSARATTSKGDVLASNTLALGDTTPRATVGRHVESWLNVRPWLLVQASEV